jgi:hypothetical protein
MRRQSTTITTFLHRGSKPGDQIVITGTQHVYKVLRVEGITLTVRPWRWWDSLAALLIHGWDRISPLLPHGWSK